MNEETIKQLLVESGLNVSAGDPDFIVPQNLLKFSELVIRKCARLAREETSLPYDSYSQKILKTFGIEDEY